MGAGGNGNNLWEWEGNWNKTRLNVGSEMGMGMNHWEWEGMELKKTFPLTSASAYFRQNVRENYTSKSRQANVGRCDVYSAAVKRVRLCFIAFAVARCSQLHCLINCGPKVGSLPVTYLACSKGGGQIDRVGGKGWSHGVWLGEGLPAPLSPENFGILLLEMLHDILMHVYVLLNKLQICYS